MSKKHWKLLLTVVLVVVLSLALSVVAFAEDDGDISGGTVEAEGVTASKHVTVQPDGTYIIDLEAFSTGEVSYTETVVPCDIILVLDTSSSMDSSMSSIVGYEELSSYSGNVADSWSGSPERNLTYFYKSSDGEYHQVTIYRTRSGRNYYFTISVEGFTGDRQYGASRNLSLSDLRTAVRELTGQSDAGLWSVVTENITRLKALQNAVNAFLGEVANNNEQDGLDPADYSRVSIVTFNQTSSVITGSRQANANSFVGVVWNDDHSKVMSTQTTPVDMENLVNTMPTAAWTYTHLGMNNAVSILNDLGTSTERKHIVVLFTDGVPCNSGFGDTFNYEFATSVINSAHNIKDPAQHGATMFTIAVYPGADPTVDPTTATGSANATLINKLLHAASSNFPTASASGNMNITFGSRDASAEHYFVPSSADELKKIFETIGKESGSTKSDLDATTVMKDIVSSSFTLPEGADEDDINIFIIPWDSSDEVHNWSTTVKYTPDQWKTECLNYYEVGKTPPEEGEDVAVNISADRKTIDITGFNYAAHYLATSDPALDKEDVNKQAAKIYIYFEIDAKPSAVTGGQIATNGPESGIYFNGEPVISFPLPQVKYMPVTYVVDYVTSDTSTDTKASSIKLEYSNVLKNVEMLDDPSDDVLKGVLAVDFDYTIYKGRYGTISFGDDELDVQRRYVRYAPTTMNWDGYDRIFVKGESATSDDKDVWAMMAVIPANSVFYEDTYITQTKEVTYNGQQVTIEYTGINYDSSWSMVGTEGQNQTYHAGDDMGWIVGLADDSGYANDMAHFANTARAQATFTFSGTGVDIYSRTNGTTGRISINIKSNPKTDAEGNPVKDDEGKVIYLTEDGKKVNKSKSIDTKAAAGDFFAIPVCTFTDLPYGTYTVTITVTAGAQAEGRMAFYLDGVRVYNPIKPLESDGNVQQMYGAKNLGAVFTEVRSMLLANPAEATAQALYIDEHWTADEVDDAQAIKDAEAALAEAQRLRDEYVETYITPAKNAVSAAEYALSSAEGALTSATNIYVAAKAAYDDAVAALDAADPESEGYADLVAAVEAAEAAMNTALTNKETANTAYNTALAKFNAEIGGLRAALQTAIDGRASYDAAVETAREAYEAASNNVIKLEYTGNIAEYKKEGPKAEVLLSNGQSVAINVVDGKTYFIGLRSLNGGEVTATIGNETVTLYHAVDLYYEAIPVSGKIVITNTSDNVLSVTKLRTTGVGNTTSGAKFAPTEETMAVVRSLFAMAAAPYAGEVLTEEEATAPIEEPVAEEPIAEEPAAEPEETFVDLDPTDIVIENPEPTETEPAAEEPAEPEPAETAPVDNGMSKILSRFFNFFRRR